MRLADEYQILSRGRENAIDLKLCLQNDLSDSVQDTQGTSTTGGETIPTGGGPVLACSLVGM